LWLPEAHVEAPTVGSVILAGILLKLGYYSIVRFVFSITYGVLNKHHRYLVMAGAISCIYSALLTLGQSDLKKIIAYSSVSHMSLGFLGLLTNSIFAFVGAFILAIGHTFVSSGLFILIGCFYERYHTRQMVYVLGLSNITPIFSFFIFYFILSNFGFPISINFLGEFLIFVGITKMNFLVALSLFFYSIFSLFYNL
jgi:NADH-quinone oxidoreductase subunit M